jgi:predicted nucleic acid-binding Zn ribbon protein
MPSWVVPREGGCLSPNGRKPDYRIEPGTDCWLWLKCLRKGGYGNITIDSKPLSAHRAYYEAAHGPIPEGHEVHHTCRNPLCVNPDHLECIAVRQHQIEHNLHDGGLSLEDVAEIRRLGTLGLSYQEVADQFGIASRRVKRYWQGERWADFFSGAVRPLARICAVCGAAIDSARPRGTKYCSDRCRAKVSQANRPKRDRRRKRGV